MSELTQTRSDPDERVVSRWRIEVVSGPSKRLTRRRGLGVVSVGSAPDNDLVLDDRQVSRHHVQLALRPGGVGLRDLGSKNGTFYLGSRVHVLELSVSGGTITVGKHELTILPDDQPVPLELSPRERCCDMVGRTPAMRRLFAQLEQIAGERVTVLVQGETGTGKELVANAVHQLSDRHDKPFVVVDCASIPTELIESQLFGHVRGAFSGAVADRRGAFLEADGGTLFLDEIGELPMALQPRLLRVLESGTFQPLGSDKVLTTDVRIIAASLRDLADEVRQKRFRADLFFRLSVLRVALPPLRDRTDDIPLLVEHFLRQLKAQPLGADDLKTLAKYAWPGNVRHLRNVLESAAAQSRGGPLRIAVDDLDPANEQSVPDRERLMELPYKFAKEAVIDGFTREYLEALLARHQGNITAAAREAQLDRNWIVELATRLGVAIR